MINGIRMKLKKLVEPLEPGFRRLGAAIEYWIRHGRCDFCDMIHPKDDLFFVFAQVYPHQELTVCEPCHAKYIMPQPTLEERRARARKRNNAAL